jgi:hypothetical protein
MAKICTGRHFSLVPAAVRHLALAAIIVVAVEVNVKSSSVS